VTAGESPEYRRLSDQLAQAQDDASRQVEQARRRHSHRRPLRYQSRADLRTPLKWVFFPLCVGALLFVGAIQIGPAIAAAEGHGTAGYFVAEAEICSSKYGCHGWSGDFVAPDGRVLHRNVNFMGPHGALRRGDRLAALDTGDASHFVYARRGDYYWIADLAMIIVGALGAGLWAWLVPIRTMRHRAGSSAFA
jgi:hypothetical protein